MAAVETMNSGSGSRPPLATVGVPIVPHRQKTRKSLSHYAGRSVQIVFGNLATSAKYILERLTSSSNPKLRAFKIATVIITSPILALPFLFMTILKPIADRIYFPRQARFSYDDQWDTNPPKELSDYRLDLPFGKGSTLTGYDIPPAPGVKHKGTVVYFHDKHSTAASIFQHKNNRIQCMVAEGYRVICATYPGYGGSSGMILSPEDVRWAGQVFVDHARKLITDDAPELVLWGWSTGANVAARLADDNSEAVTKVVLQSPSPWLDNCRVCTRTGERADKIIKRKIANAPADYLNSCDREVQSLRDCNPLLTYHFNTRHHLLRFVEAGADKETVLLHYNSDTVSCPIYSNCVFNYLDRKATRKGVRLYTVRGAGVEPRYISSGTSCCVRHNPDHSSDDFREGKRLHKLMPRKVVSAALRSADSAPDLSNDWWLAHYGDTVLLG